MSFRTPGGLGRRIPGSRPRLLAPVLITLAVLVALYFVFAGIWTDLLWYRSLGGGFSGVYSKLLWTKVMLFFGGGLLMAAAVAANMIIAYRLRPAYRPVSVEQQGLERYRNAIDPHRRLAAIGLLAAIALFTGLSSAGQSGTWLAFMNRTPFGVKDAQFHMDVSFYVFTYPFLRLLLGFLFVMVVLSLLVAVAVHYLYGGLRLQGPGDKASPSARAHLSVLVGSFVLLKAVAYWFDRWGLAFSERGKVTGPSYTDVNAVLPAKTILAAIALICAILFFVNIWRRGMMLPGVGFGLLVLSAILVGGVYPLLIQQFQVKPNELAKESPYIARNIEATRKAYGVDGVQVQDYTASKTLTKDQVDQYGKTLPNVRLLDPMLLSPTFKNDQQLQGFYNFANPLDIDRYPNAKGGRDDTLVAVRELTTAPGTAPGWVNEHLTYTHGYGFVSAPGNEVSPERKGPVYNQFGMPQDCQPKDKAGKCSLTVTRPQVYFGERSPQYSIVGDHDELDYPTSAVTRYTGNGGVPLGSFVNRLLYATKFKDRNILLSGSVSDRSRILYDRSPRDRVQKAAPWLTVDSDPYPVAADGRLVWVLDGYTTSSGFPYSERLNLQETTLDSNSERPSGVKQTGGDVNYIRNSVKATVDAYDGTVTLYTWDESDPILKTWKKAFPGTVKDKGELKTAYKGELYPHLRYPADIFKVQRGILSRYHVTDAQSLYSGQDNWQIPDDPTSNGGTEPPYYLTIQMPPGKGQTKIGDPGFSLTTTYQAKNGTNLTGYLAVDSVPESGQYGQLRLLKVPREVAINSPGQMQNAFKGNPTVASSLNRPAGSTTQVVYGNLLTIPFGGGFLYVEPVYQQSTSPPQFPLLGSVLVSFGDKIGFAPTFSEALQQVLSGGGKVPPTEGSGDTPAQPTAPSAGIQALIDDVNNAYKEAQTALKNQDLTAYAAAQKKLGEAIQKLVAAQNAQKTGTPATTPSTPASTEPPTAPTTSASPSATPS
ncbi:UPF0182 family protein [Actinocorallia longicatena]|uniref:UPF0182 protein GCM10010468_10670 n=1 Tax=Actinocorallia longicatena TaxID=111803 RepID=A0ABP6Q3A3_9ACTN